MTTRNPILCAAAVLLAAGCSQPLPQEPPAPVAAAVPPVTVLPPDQLAVRQPAKATPADGAPVAANAGPNDHSMFGGTRSRNMVNLGAKIDKLPTEGPAWDDPEAVKAWSAEWLLWKADLGSRAYGGPTVAGGKVFVGTNNERPRNGERDIHRNKGGLVEPIDKGILMCFDEKTGKFLWQAVHDKLPNGNVTDWPKEGLCSTPTVEGNRVYYISNRCTIVCADVDGFANGNDGVQSEKYKEKTDVDIVWEYDLIRSEDVFPHNMSAGCPLIVGDLLYTVTANGVDENHINLPSPFAPSFIALNKTTGKVVWKSNLPGKNIMHGQWSNPTYAEIGGTKQVIFPGGDGWLYGFTPDKGELIWKFDANPKWAVYDLGGTGNKNDFIGTPVIYDNKIYIGIGQDPEHSSGIANFFCISPTKTGDISKFLEARQKGADGSEEVVEKPNPNSCEVWRYGWDDKRKWAPRDFKFGRTMSTACIVDGLIYIAEVQGYLHCLDAKTGKQYWVYDTKTEIWGSPFYADGRVFLGNSGGDLYVFRHDKQPKTIDPIEAAKDAPDRKAARVIQRAKQAEIEKEYKIGKIEFPSGIRSTPVVANGVLYVMTENTLYAIKTK